jgi:translocation protein SEC63
VEELVKDMIAQAEQQGGERYEKPKTITEDYASKAHALLFAHFNRFDVNDAHLRADQEQIVAKACHLVLGMLQIALARQWLQTANHCISLVQMLVQACPENPSPLLQLPHIDAQIAKHARGRKTPIRSVRQLLEMSEEDRRSLLRTLSDDEYKNLVAVAKTFPEIYIDSVKFVTLGQPHVIPSGLVTVKIKLRIINAGEDLNKTESEEVEEDDVENFEFDEDGNLIDSAPIRSISPNDPRSSSTLPIHCPRFPNEKRPFWWVVLTNMSNTAIVTPPIKVFDLIDTKTVTLQFTAPNRPGQIAVNVHVKSDSLVGADVYKACTVNIMPARAAPSKEEQWDISGEDSDASSAGFDSDYEDNGAGMSGSGCGDIGCSHAH